MVKLVYFAWVRERIGVAEEAVDLPPEVVTVADLLDGCAPAATAMPRRCAIRKPSASPSTTSMSTIAKSWRAPARSRFSAHDGRLTGDGRTRHPHRGGDFDIAAEIERIRGQNLDIGAVVTFSVSAATSPARCARSNSNITGNAEAELTRIAREALGRWPLTGVTVIHRHGLIEPGQNIVLVVAASAHRQAAFEAASFLMDYLKSRAPFWKKEHRLDGSQGDWVEAKVSDDVAAERWRLE